MGAILTILAILGFGFKYRNQVMAVLNFFKTKKAEPDVVATSTVSLTDGKPKIHEIVKVWESLRGMLNAAGLTDAVKAMDEVFLNLLTKENTAKKVR